MEMDHWPVFGAKSRPDQFQDALYQLPSDPFGASLREIGAPRVDFGTRGKSKIGPDSHFRGWVGTSVLEK